jgi:putative acetyltransferase
MQSFNNWHPVNNSRIKVTGCVGCSSHVVSYRWFTPVPIHQGGVFISAPARYLKPDILLIYQTNYFYRMKNVTIRNIQPQDNPILSKIVKDTLAEFGANHPNTVYYDPTTDALFEMFQKKGAAYFVAEINDEIVGGGGIYPTDGLPADTCELVKMYLLPHARGTGLGRTLIEKCIATSKAYGYKQIYLESMPELKQALKIYAKFGFEYLKGPMGNSGHTGCSLWMLLCL